MLKYGTSRSADVHHGALRLTRNMSSTPQTHTFNARTSLAEIIASTSATTHGGQLLVVLVQLEAKRDSDPDSDPDSDANNDRLLLSRVQRELDRLGRSNSPNGFTATERRVAAAVLSGSRNSDIALSEFMSIRTVEAHLSAIYRKADVHSRTQLIAKLLTKANISQ
ncbi:MAG: LuxR family transcription regulator [Subtercola sp.]|nr:LuxR family transcription regulator [Subtercola sp.]